MKKKKNLKFFFCHKNFAFHLRIFKVGMEEVWGSEMSLNWMIWRFWSRFGFRGSLLFPTAIKNSVSRQKILRTLIWEPNFNLNGQKLFKKILTIKKILKTFNDQNIFKNQQNFFQNSTSPPLLLHKTPSLPHPQDILLKTILF